VPCDGSDDPRQRCGLHHDTGLADIFGGYQCCCGDSWLGGQSICSSSAEHGTPVSFKDRLDSLISWADTADEREAVADVVFAELDRLAERIPYREGETEEQYLERQVARWRSETHDARVRAKAAETALEAAEDLTGRLREDHRAEITEAEKQIRTAEAAIARVREIHPRESTGLQDVCLICFDEEGEFAPWPCPTIAALDQPKEP
jgi:hypothetical protein